MSKITVNDDALALTVSSINIPIGTVFTGTIFGTYKSLFASVYNPLNNSAIPSIVDLRNLSKVWSREVDVYDYKEVNITITIEE